MKNMLKSKNNGSSLIEVIVSMLILAIIVVPMLNMFVTSAKVNRKTQLQQYATTVAENVMESVMAEAAGYTIATATAGADGSYSQHVTGLSQGTGAFSADITYDPSPYKLVTGDLNNYSMPDITSLSSVDTAIINVDFTSEEESIADYFYQSHVYAVEFVNQEIMNAALEAYWAAWSEWNNWDPVEHNGDAQPADPPNRQDYEDQATASMETELTKDQIEQAITRTVNLTIQRDSTTGLIRVKADVIYLLPEDINVGQEEGTAGSYSSEFFNSNWYAVADLKQIYLLYKPYDATLDGTQSVNKEQITFDMDAVHQLSDFKADFFLVTQGTTAATFTEKLTLYMTSTVAEYYSKLSVYSKSLLAIYYKNAAGTLFPAPTGYNPVLVPLLSPEDMIYQVTVTVCEQGKSDQLAEVISTLYR